MLWLTLSKEELGQQRRQEGSCLLLITAVDFHFKSWGGGGGKLPIKFNNSVCVNHKPMKFGTFVPYMCSMLAMVTPLTIISKLELKLGKKSTLRFFYL